MKRTGRVALAACDGVPDEGTSAGGSRRRSRRARPRTPATGMPAGRSSWPEAWAPGSPASSPAAWHRLPAARRGVGPDVTAARDGSSRPRWTTCRPGGLWRPAQRGRAGDVRAGQPRRSRRRLPDFRTTFAIPAGSVAAGQSERRRERRLPRRRTPTSTCGAGAPERDAVRLREHRQRALRELRDRRSRRRHLARAGEPGGRRRTVPAHGDELRRPGDGVQPARTPSVSTTSLATGGSRSRSTTFAAARRPRPRPGDPRRARREPGRSLLVLHRGQPGGARQGARRRTGARQPVLVFLTAGTDLGYSLTVTDTASGLQRTYANEDGALALPVQDVDAFPAPERPAGRAAPGSGQARCRR